MTAPRCRRCGSTRDLTCYLRTPTRMFCRNVRACERRRIRARLVEMRATWAASPTPTLTARTVAFTAVGVLDEAIAATKPRRSAG